MKQAIFWATAAGVLALAAPALADTKAGWDAWQRGDYRTAVDEWRGPAIAGDADAQFNLGQAYKLGRGVPVDPGLAESWFRKAALQHHPLAEDNYALALYQSDRRAEALPWLEKSVARGEPRTELVLGTMLFNGDGVPRNVPRAYALMTRASQAGLKPASETLAQMDSYVSPADRQKGTALAQQLAAAQATVAASTPGRMVVSTDAPRPADLPGPVPAPAMSSAPSRPAPGRPSKPVKPVAKAEIAAAEHAPAPVKAAPVKVAPVRAAPTKSAPTKPAPAKPAATGRVRVQLGAFKDEGNARALWSRVGGRLGGSASYVKAGGFTRLIAGGFASEADAQRACRAAKVACVVVR